MIEKRFELKSNLDKKEWDIIDHVESKEKNAIVIYNDLGSIYFSATPHLCLLLNDLYEETVEKEAQLNQLLDKVDGIHHYDDEVLSKYAEKYNRGSGEFKLICDIAEELGVAVSLLKAKDDDD